MQLLELIFIVYVNNKLMRIRALRATSGNLSAKRRRKGSCIWESSVHMELEKKSGKNKGKMDICWA